MHELKRLRQQDETYFEFDFESESNPQHAIPYVAKLGWSGDSYERHFFELERVYGKNSVLVTGSFAAQEGEIIELCRGGNTQRKYRSIYIVYMGRLEFLAKSDDAKAKHEIKRYLTYQCDLQELRNALL